MRYWNSKLTNNLGQKNDSKTTNNIGSEGVSNKRIYLLAARIFLLAIKI